MWEAGNILIPILEVGNLKLREGNSLAQGHTAANPDPSSHLLRAAVKLSTNALLHLKKSMTSLHIDTPLFYMP